MKKIILISVIFIFISISSYSQEKENLTFLFSLEDVKKTSDTTYAAKIIHKNMPAPSIKESGSVFSIHNADSMERDLLLGKVKGITGNTGLSEILIYATKEVKDGDLVELTVDIAENKFRNIFYELIRLNIRFLNGYDEFFFNDETILFNEDVLQEEENISILSEDIKFVAGKMLEKMESPAVIGGRFNGFDLFSAMEESNERDVLSFLRFVKENPRKYMGNNWKISEVYATWIVSKTPIVEYDFKEIINLQKSDEEFAEIVRWLDKSGLAKFTSEWNEQAEKLGKEEKFKEAYDLINLSLKSSEIFKDTLQIAWGYFSRANIQLEEKQYEKAIENYNLAILQLKIYKHNT